MAKAMPMTCKSGSSSEAIREQEELARLRRIEAKHSELVELAGRIVDRLDNLLSALKLPLPLSALKLPLPPHIHLMGLRESLPEIRAELAEALDRALRGEEP